MKYHYFGFLFLMLMACEGFAQAVPEYTVDASWPGDLPDNWVLGQVAGIDVDEDDNIWVVHRPHTITEWESGAMQDPPLSRCCVPAPSVLQFDGEGNLLQAWGGPTWNRDSRRWRDPAHDWPANEHGIYVDAEGFVWLAGNGEGDHSIFKFTGDGRHVMTIGAAGESEGSNDTRRLGRPADLFVDTMAQEVYVADGYGNRRVVVFDSETGEYRRHWGAYGNTPDDGPLPAYTEGMEPVPQFMGPVHGIIPGPGNRLYVADRAANRIQVFERDGTFVREAVMAPWTLANGSVWDLAVSPYESGRWLFVADGRNMKVWIVERESLEVFGSFGRGGRQAGQFDMLHNIAVDSGGNIYTAEVNNGRRIQKFIRMPH